MKMTRSSFLAVIAAVLMVAIPQTRAETITDPEPSLLGGHGGICLNSLNSKRTAVRLGEVCSGVDCQQGTCVPLSNNSYPTNILSPYVCACKPGWQTVEGLLAALPHVLSLPCTVPNCTLSLGCTSSATPPLSFPTTLEHISSPCSLPGICGQGECEVTDSTKYPPVYKCHCQLGYANVGNLTAGYCLKDCEIGTNCRAIGVTLPSKSAGSFEASVRDSFLITLAVVAASCFALRSQLPKV